MQITETVSTNSQRLSMTTTPTTPDSPQGRHDQPQPPPANLTNKPPSDSDSDSEPDQSEQVQVKVRKPVSGSDKDSDLGSDVSEVVDKDDCEGEGTESEMTQVAGAASLGGPSTPKNLRHLIPSWWMMPTAWRWMSFPLPPATIITTTSIWPVTPLLNLPPPYLASCS